MTGMSAERLQEIRDAREAFRAAEADGRYTGRTREVVERWAAMQDGAVADLLAEVDRLRAVEQNLRDIIDGALVEYTVAYRWPNGNVVPFGSASYYRAGVQRDVDEANRNEQGNPALLARRLVTQWTPAGDGDQP